MDVDHGYFNNVSRTSLYKLTAFRSAPPRTIAFWELISLSSDDDLELFVHNRFRVQIQFALGCMILILDSSDNRLQSNQRSLRDKLV
jgi:hypothetical protein